MEGLLDVLFGLVSDEAKNLQRIMWRNINWFLLLVLLGVGLQYKHLTYINIIIYVALTYLMFRYMVRFKVFAIIEAYDLFYRVSKGLIKSSATIEKPSERDFYVAIMNSALLWLNIVYMILITAPIFWFPTFLQAISMTMIALICISVISYAALAGWTKTVIYKKILLSWATAGIVFVVANMILVHAFGGAIYGIGGSSKAYELLYKTEYRSKEMSDTKLTERADPISKKLIANGGDESVLTPEEKPIWDEVKRVGRGLIPNFNQPKTREVSIDVPAPAPEPRNEVRTEPQSNDPNGSDLFQALPNEGRLTVRWGRNLEHVFQARTHREGKQFGVWEINGRSNGKFSYYLPEVSNGNLVGNWREWGQIKGPIHMTLNRNSNIIAEGTLTMGGEEIPIQLIILTPEPRNEAATKPQSNNPNGSDSLQALPGEVTVRWGKNLEHVFRAKTLRERKQFGVAQINGKLSYYLPEVSNGNLAGYWREWGQRKGDVHMRLIRSSNVLAEGTLTMGGEEIPIQLTK
jgi:hypothetical protein